MPVCSTPSKRNRTATPGITGGATYDPGLAGLRVGVFGRWQQTAEVLAILSVAAPSRVYEFSGYSDPVAINLTSNVFGRRFARIVEQGDKDADGALSRAELKDLPQRPQNRPGRGRAEYYMPDLDHPTEPGTRTVPVFFVDNQSVPFGTKDVDRRGALAESMVSPRNPWFARAFVNRTWSEMMGQGFTEPVDDMGPNRPTAFGDVLEIGRAHV